MRLLLCSLFICIQLMTVAQEKIDLYPNGIPNTKEGADISINTPEFYRYTPDTQISDVVFLIIPGGGYSHVAMNHEGHDVAKRLQSLGYASYVLRYRLPNAKQMESKKIAPIQDAQTALRYIREETNDLKVGMVAVIGFSAGGHLASTLSTHYATDYVRGSSLDGKTDLIPDFSVLVYPVITMEDGVTHNGSKMNLIGPELIEGDVQLFSNENNVSSKTPKTYIVHAVDDKAVPIENAYRYKSALDKNGIANKLYQYEKGGHGFGMNNKLEEGDWFADMIDWIQKNK